MSRPDHPYASFAHLVEKPARYLGGELFSVEKRPEDVEVSICLTFPDVYDLGMSHLGTKILYKVLNDNEKIACERCFAPWHDMERELRARDLTLYSLETTRPLADFDVLGFSLQYELTYTNVLTILDLAGLALRAADRKETDPLILGGGPVATHPEACAPFFDAFLLGDAEQRLPELLLEYKRDRNAGLSKREALIRMAMGGGAYVPELYTTEIDPRSGLLCVSGTIDERVPEVVERAFVADLNEYPFPDNSPVASAQAIFDRLSIEIARGCTEGCRFCQAGMIYRPVRERDPNDVVDTIVRAIEKGGYDEASLTSLSTADYSCIEPLIGKVMSKLRERHVSLGVASLRAYGLGDRVLDEIRSVRATGLTFAPEAGTQRMRDIVNKNVSEEDMMQTAHRVFSKGWKRMKLYFMIGLPLEEEADVAGIVQTGARMKKIGRQYIGRRAEVQVSVSSHVPKPHTPFQWAAMDSIESIQNKQRVLREMARHHRVAVKYHDVRMGYLEGIMARGDRRVADVVERAWRAGCRFDSWDDGLKWETWLEALRDTPEVDPMVYLGTLPVDGRLPWDHLDVGLADGFLAREWKRTCKGKLSPPCGKPAGDIIHPTNLQAAAADQRKLVCYHCGVACDLSEMRSERLRFLDSLGALAPPTEEVVVAEPERRSDGRMKPPEREGAVRPEDMVRYRIQYIKSGLLRLQGHSDMLRILPRALRRANLPIGYSWGFHPKPIFSFSPATPLGTYSVSEMVDVSLTDVVSEDDLLKRLNATPDPGLHFVAARLLLQTEKKVAAKLHSTDYLVALPGATPDEVMTAARKAMAAETIPLTVMRKHKEKTMDGRPGLVMARLAASTLWPEAIGIKPEAPLLHLRVRLDIPSARPQELAAYLFGNDASLGPIVRVGFHRLTASGRLASPIEAPEMPPESASATV